MRGFLFLFWIFPVIGQPFSYQIDLSPQPLSLLQNLRIEATLTYPQGYEPGIDVMRRHLLDLNDFIVMKERISLPIRKGEGWEQTIEWELSPQVPGSHTITFFAIPFRSDQNDPVELISDLYSVKVTMPKDVNLAYEGTLAPLMVYPPVPTLAHQPKADLKRQQEMLEAKEIPLYWILVFLFLAGLVPFFYLKLKFPKKIIPIDPKNEALTAIENLKKEEFDYMALTDVVRKYIEKRYHLKATTSTTEEFLESVSTKPILQKESLKLLEAFLEDTDRVKFAHYLPSKDEALHALYSARAFIERT